jgi:hypothetical protein
MKETVSFLLEREPYQIILLSLFITGLIPFSGQYAAHVAGRRGWLHHTEGFQGVMVTAIATLFSLFSAFVANDIWSRLEVARSAVVREADGIQLMMRLTEGLPAGETKYMYNALEAHVKTAVEDEWPKMALGRSSPKAVDGISGIAEAIVTFEVGKSEGAEFQGRLLTTFSQIRDSWRIRTEIAKDRGLTIKWFGMLVFGFLTQICIGLVHVTRPKAMFVAQTIFALAFATLCSFLFMYEFPFSHMTPISHEPLQTAIELKHIR